MRIIWRYKDIGFFKSIACGQKNRVFIMLKSSILFGFLLVFAGRVQGQISEKISNPVDFVNPIMGNPVTLQP
jgi:hypothetical protein